MGEAEELEKREKESGGAPKSLGSRVQEKEVASGRERWAIPRAWSHPEDRPRDACRCEAMTLSKVMPDAS